MPLGTNPTLLQIQAFFGGPGNLRAYYRGGPYVPDISANAAISTDPNSLTLRQFSGADNVQDWSINVTPNYVQIANSTAWTSVPLAITINNAPGAASYNTTTQPPDGMLGAVDNPATANPTVRGRKQTSQPSTDIGQVTVAVTINGVTKYVYLSMYMG